MHSLRCLRSCALQVPSSASVLCQGKCLVSCHLDHARHIVGPSGLLVEPLLSFTKWRRLVVLPMLSLCLFPLPSPPFHQRVVRCNKRSRQPANEQ